MKSETVGFGTHIIIDGRGANPERLADTERVRQLAVRLAEQLDPGNPPHIALYQTGADDQRGISAGAVMPESQLVLHTFPARRLVSLDAFSRRETSPWSLVEALGTSFEVGRVESYLANRARTLPRDPVRLEPAILGDRGYVSVRLDDSLLATETTAEPGREGP